MQQQPPRPHHHPGYTSIIIFISIYKLRKVTARRSTGVLNTVAPVAGNGRRAGSDCRAPSAPRPPVPLVGRALAPQQAARSAPAKRSLRSLFFAGALPVR